MALYVVCCAVRRQDEAMDRGFVGCEWWIQARETIDPKEYHMVSPLAIYHLHPCHFDFNAPRYIREINLT